MIGKKKRTKLLQYILKKHHRWGIKLSMLCDAITSVSYTHLDVYKRQQLHYITVLVALNYKMFQIKNLYDFIRLFEDEYSLCMVHENITY